MKLSWEKKMTRTDNKMDILREVGDRLELDGVQMMMLGMHLPNDAEVFGIFSLDEEALTVARSTEDAEGNNPVQNPELTHLLTVSFNDGLVNDAHYTQEDAEEVGVHIAGLGENMFLVLGKLIKD